MEWEGTFSEASQGIWQQGICVLRENEEEGKDGGYKVGGGGGRLSID